MDDSNIRFLTLTAKYPIPNNRAVRKSAENRIRKVLRGLTTNLIDHGVAIEPAGATFSASYDDRKWELEEQLIEPRPPRRITIKQIQTAKRRARRIAQRRAADRRLRSTE